MRYARVPPSNCPSAVFSIGDSSVFGLSTGMRNSNLAFGEPGDEIVTKEGSIDGSRLASVRAASPISVQVDHKIRLSRRTQQESQVQSASNISQNLLESGQMRLPRIMHMKTDLLDSICDVWTGEGQVLQCAGSTAEVGRISYRNTTIRRELGICINRRGTRLAVRHASSLKDLHDVLMLR